ncbi:MUSK [Mytilus edulis]|uniref:MUSK n=1 Tax=Mytilus edulis TaxID=6550 RepID=A0A8S3TKC4_MYTED|nr:MUSK [Mytilus edulis]
MVTVSDENTDDESTNASTQTISCIDIQRYRSLEKAIRVTAYVLRFIQNLRNSRDKRTIGFISVEERCKALEVLIVAAQQQTFKDEIESLNSSSQKKVQLVRQLKLYTDKSGLLRCTGRIQNAPVKESTKYPLLLPTHHSLTSLIVMDAHTKTLHAGLNKDCYSIGKTGSVIYNGHINQTRSGIPCQRWDQKVPRIKYPMGSEHVNYCRNPHNDKGSLWCYTISTKITWQYCNVPRCGSHRNPRPRSPKTITTVHTLQLTTEMSGITKDMTDVNDMNVNDRNGKQPPTEGKQTEDFVIGSIAVLLVVFSIAVLVHIRKNTIVKKKRWQAKLSEYVINRDINGPPMDSRRETNISASIKTQENIEMNEQNGVPMYAVVHKRNKDSNIISDKTKRFAITSGEYDHTSFIIDREEAIISKNYGALRLHNDVTDDLYDVGNCKGVRESSMEETYDHFVNRTDANYENVERYSQWTDGVDCSNTSTPSKSSK